MPCFSSISMTRCSRSKAKSFMSIVGTNSLEQCVSKKALSHTHKSQNQKITWEKKQEQHIRRIREQIIHLLQRPPLGLRLEGPEPQGVGEIANDEQDVVAPADAFHGDGGDLADEGVESEADHDADGDAFAARARVEDFGGDDPCLIGG